MALLSDPAVAGRRAARTELALPASCTELVERLSIPNGAVFLAWTGVHALVWSLGLAAVIAARQQPALQALVGFLMGNQLLVFTGLQHDCGHRAAFRHPAGNLWLGRVLAWFIFLPFTSFTELHRGHHSSLGDPAKDPDEWFYRAGPRMLFLRECLFMPRFIALSLQRPFPADVKRRIRRELAFHALSYAGVVALLAWLDRLDVLVFAMLVPMLSLAVFYNPIGRGYEHYPMSLLPLDDERRKDLRFNSISVTSRLFGFLWGHITFHVEHHMYPRVPCYRLPQLHRLFEGKAYFVGSVPLGPWRRRGQVEAVTPATLQEGLRDAR